ncbi:MAG: diguanylate cyclase (GGDEF)-like protein [Glaciecola sp.]|jgi:diguanylate cyclase (GGDEF)-like protein|uniref:GGDEF domain-containing protein n=1 Tax=Congregibacter sp. TaxID=2744308 RepID=UPI0039E2ED7A
MVIDPYFNFLVSTVFICMMLAAANAMLAVRSISFSAATAHAIAFAAMAFSWLLTVLLPLEASEVDLRLLLLLNGIGAGGVIALWSGLHLRAGYRVNGYFVGALFGIWIAPVLGIVILGFDRSSHVPFTAASIIIGAVWSTWLLYRKRGKKNAGDWALILWMALVIPVSVVGMTLGMSSARSVPNAPWVFYLSFLPTIFAGVGLFTLVSVALDALRDSNELARTDGLTGLLNRRAFDSELDIAVARAERYQRDLSLIAVDIDNFKALNDNYGHPAGDAVLRAVARVMTETARRIDVINRIGGDEFALILQDTPASAALRLAERLRHAISNAGTDSIAFTASFGVSSSQDVAPGSEALLQSADEALYAAKDAGRNCVRYAQDPTTEPAGLIGLVR